MDPGSQNEPVLILTEQAVRWIKALRGEQPENAGKMLRIYIEAGGCCAAQYGLMFDEPREDDVVCTEHGVSVLVDKMSVSFLRGAKLDFEDGVDGGGFKVVNTSSGQ